MTMQYNPSLLLRLILVGGPLQFQYFTFYSDAQPSDCMQPNSVNLLAATTVALNYSSTGGDYFPDGQPGSYTTPIVSTTPVLATVSAAGTVASFRLSNFSDGNGPCTAQGSVGLSGSGADLILSSVVVAVNDIITIDSVSLNLTIS